MDSPPSGTVTFLFSDIEGSTRRWQDDPEAMRALLVDHDAIMRDVIDEHRGFLFKHTGDGIAAVFSSASGAVAAAVDAQGRLREVLPVRMGLHTGEAELRDGDYFGSTLNRCARLMAIGHGGQIVCSDATAGLVRDRDDLRDLGEHRLRDLTRPEHVWQVGGGEFAALRSLEVVPGNLPLQLSSFVGREGEVAEVAGLLVEHRLVTLTGVGGVGKTRLALQVAAEVAPRFVDGVWLVELAPVLDAGGVGDAVADALGLRPHSGKTAGQLALEVVALRSMLVVLDNAEHLIEGVARFAEQLLGSAPRARLLVTSREGLAVRGERIVALRSLGVPDERAGLGVAVRAPAVQLLVDRACDARHDFELRDDNVVAAVQLCRRLDGIPLAIELAAARVRSMSLGEIADRLDQRFRLLKGATRTAVERHSTLRRVVDWSYDLLSGEERTVLRRLSVFVGGSTEAAAERVVAGGGIEVVDVLDLLSNLVDKSLVVVDDEQGTSRYRLLETIRQYAEERLDDAGEADATRRGHADWMIEFLGQARAGIRGPDALGWLRRTEREFDNLRAAVAWAIAAGDGERVATLLTTLGMEALYGTPIGSVIPSLAEAAVEMPGIGEHRRYPTLLALSGFAMHQRQEPQADELVSRAVELWDSGRFERQPLPAGVYVAIAGVNSRCGDPTLMRRMAQSLVELARESGDPFEIGYALNAYAGVEAMLRGEPAAALLAEAQHIGETLNSQKLLASCALVEATLLWLEGDTQLVIAAADNARRRSHALQLRNPATLTTSAYSFQTHTLDELSRSIYRWVVRASADDLDHATLVVALHLIGLSLGVCGQLAAGAQLYGYTRPLVTVPNLDRAPDIALGSARAQFEHLAQTSTLKTIDEAVTYALTQLDTLDNKPH